MALVSRQRMNGNEGKWYQADLRSIDETEKLAEAVLQDFGSVDLLFNSAGVLHPGMYDLSMEQLNATLELNLRAPFILMKRFLPAMEARGRGHIINVSSRSGKIGFPGAGVYCASKFGLNGLNEATYRAYSAKGIKVTALVPVLGGYPHG